VSAKLEYLRELERVSAAAGLSKYHLDRVFKRATGLRPHTYMRLLAGVYNNDQIATSTVSILRSST